MKVLVAESVAYYRLTRPVVSLMARPSYVNNQ